MILFPHSLHALEVLEKHRRPEILYRRGLELVNGELALVVLLSVDYHDCGQRDEGQHADDERDLEERVQEGLVVVEEILVVDEAGGEYADDGKEVGNCRDVDEYFDESD